MADLEKESKGQWRRRFLTLLGFGAGGLAACATGTDQLAVPTDEPTPKPTDKPTEISPTSKPVEPTAVPTQEITDPLLNENDRQIQINKVMLEFWSKGKVEGGTLFNANTTKIKTRVLPDFNDPNNPNLAATLMSSPDFNGNMEFTVPVTVLNGINTIKPEDLKRQLDSLLDENNGEIPPGYGPLFVTAGDNPNYRVAGENMRPVRVDSVKIREVINPAGEWEKLKVLPEAVPVSLRALTDEEKSQMADLDKLVKETVKSVSSNLKVESYQKDWMGNLFVTVTSNTGVRLNGAVVTTAHGDCFISLMSAGHNDDIRRKQLLNDVPEGEYPVIIPKGNIQQAIEIFRRLGKANTDGMNFQTGDELDEYLNLNKEVPFEDKPRGFAIMRMLPSEAKNLGIKVSEGSYTKEFCEGNYAAAVYTSQKQDGMYAFRGGLVDRLPASELARISATEALTAGYRSDHILLAMVAALLDNLMVGADVVSVGIDLHGAYTLNNLGKYYDSFENFDRKKAMPIYERLYYDCANSSTPQCNSDDLDFLRKSVLNIMSKFADVMMARIV